MPAHRPLACCLDVPESFRSKAAYALETLLAPLGLIPRWVPRSEVGAGLYYGPALRRPASALGLAFDSATASFFAGRMPYDPARRAHTEWDGEMWPVLFPVSPSEGDLVAASFFWLSGWQEATTAVRDVHGRFPYSASLQSEWGCIDRPLVDAYRELLAAQLEAHGVRVRRTDWSGHGWAVALTHDIDLMRKVRLGTLARAVGRSDGRRLGAVRQALLARNPRRSSIERIAAFERSRGAGATYFFKTAARGRWDVPYAHDGRWIRRTIRDLEAGGFEVGLHPSYFAHDHAGYVAEERERLAALTTASPTSVRQHFLRFDRATSRVFENAGFQLDSSLGFSAHEGFRRGTCFPFRLYDLDADAPRDLWELPLVVMDTTLFMHRRLALSEAERALARLYAACRRVGGCCVLLWHNTVYDEVDYPGQGGVFERATDRALAEGAAVLSLRAALRAFRA